MVFAGWCEVVEALEDSIAISSSSNLFPLSSLPLFLSLSSVFSSMSISSVFRTIVGSRDDILGGDLDVSDVVIVAKCERCEEKKEEEEFRDYTGRIASIDRFQ